MKGRHLLDVLTSMSSPPYAVESSHSPWARSRKAPGSCTRSPRLANNAFFGQFDRGPLSEKISACCQTDNRSDLEKRRFVDQLERSRRRHGNHIDSCPLLWTSAQRRRRDRSSRRSACSFDSEFLLCSLVILPVSLSLRQRNSVFSFRR